MLAARTRKRWQFIQARVDREQVQALARTLAVHPLVAHLLINRGLDDADAARRFLNPSLSQLHDPILLPGTARAAQRIVQAVRDRQPIVIYGDYDVDGVTASAILWHTLRFIDAEVYTYVPHRIEEGYGLNCDAIASIARGEWHTAQPYYSPPADAIPRQPLIVSVDCGITAVEPANVARELGADLIITDHHEFDPANLPHAYALVHPRLSGSAVGAAEGEPTAAYPFPDLCGAGVAFKLAWQVARAWCGSDRLPESFKTLMIDLLSLAALGTVADVVPLMDENRVITRFGLGRIKFTRFVGLNALIDAAGLRDEKIDAYHVGFVLGPRLNACGRMGHAARAVHLLTRAEPQEAAQIAEFLTHENNRRRATEREIFEEARQMVIESGFDHEDRRAIVIGKEGWHAGVIGIVASRLVERFSRPVVILSVDNGEAHGSARSVEGVCIHEALAACAEHLTTFGGHAMAAGVRLATANIEAFREALIAKVNTLLQPDDLAPVVRIDAECRLADMEAGLVQQLLDLAPFGRGNPDPTLCLRDVRIARLPMRVGNEGAHLRFAVTDGTRVVNAIAFGQGDLAEQLAPGVRVDLAFEPKLNTWGGRSSAELNVVDVVVR